MGNGSRVRLCALLVVVSWAAVQSTPAAPVISPLAPGRNAVLTVYPTGIHPADVQNVQAAVDTVDPGGTVILKPTDAAGNPLTFNFGGTAVGNGGVVRLLRPGITVTGDGWDEALDEPMTKIVGGGGRHEASPTLVAQATVFAVQAPGVTIRQIKMNATFAFTGVFITSALQPASGEPVLVEQNSISVLNYAVIAVYAAAFPVTIRDNVLKGLLPVSAQWAGLTLAPISTFPFDEPVPPTDEQGSTIRFPLVIANNVITKTPNPMSALTATVLLWGWGNAYSQSPDPDVGARRLRATASSPWVYQHFPGDNGPVAFIGNHIVADLPGDFHIMVGLGASAQGLNHALIKGNTISGVADIVIERFPYGHDIRIEDNDLSGAQAYLPVSISGPDTAVANNVFGLVLPLPPESATPDGIPQPAVALLSKHWAPGVAPVPHAVENCVIARNDYRRTGLRAGSLLVASQEELQWPFYPTGPGTGTEVKNNVIFESGGFLAGTGGARNQILLLAGLLNPATGLPYVHDNRVVGLPATELSHPGIGAIVSQLSPVRKMLDWGVSDW